MQMTDDMIKSFSQTFIYCFLPAQSAHNMIYGEETVRRSKPSMSGREFVEPYEAATVDIRAKRSRGMTSVLTDLIAFLFPYRTGSE
jgi:hypothetical protein